MQTEIRLIFKHAPQLGFAALERRPRAQPAGDKLDPSTGIRMVLDARRSTPPWPRRYPSTWSSRQRAGRVQPRMRSCSRGDGRRKHALHPSGQVEEAWRIFQPLSTRRRPSTSTCRERGVPRQRTRSSLNMEAGATPGRGPERGPRGISCQGDASERSGRAAVAASAPRAHNHRTERLGGAMKVVIVGGVAGGASARPGCAG